MTKYQFFVAHRQAGQPAYGRKKTNDERNDKPEARKAGRPNSGFDVSGFFSHWVFGYFVIGHSDRPLPI